MQPEDSVVSTPPAPGRHSAPQVASGSDNGADIEAGTDSAPTATSTGTSARIPPRMEDVQPCGRLGEHEPHVWLTRNNTWCAGTGVAGKGGTPKVGRVLRRQERRAATEIAVREAAAAAEADESDDD